MGSWKTRIRRRRDYPNRYLYRECSSDGYHDAGSDNVPSWEKKFCKDIGSIPWGKVVFSKTLLNYHDNILHWDDLASEEAFQNAKKRYWSAINGFKCDIPLPDPDMYIDRVNWNLVTDAELIKELDREYFNPDEMKGETGTSTEKRTDNIVCQPSERCNFDPVDDNPWERGRMQCNGSSKIRDWRSTAQKKDVNDFGWDNPWEHSYKEDNAWVDGAKLSSWSHWGDQPNKNSNISSWDLHHQNVRFPNNEGWDNSGPSASGQNCEIPWPLVRDANDWCRSKIQGKRALQHRRGRGRVGNLQERGYWDNNRIEPIVDKSLQPGNDEYYRIGSSYGYIPRHKRTKFQGGNPQS